MAPTSMGSPREVPVPCISSPVTFSAARSASVSAPRMTLCCEGPFGAVRLLERPSCTQRADVTRSFILFDMCAWIQTWMLGALQDTSRSQKQSVDFSGHAWLTKVPFKKTAMEESVGLSAESEVAESVPVMLCSRITMHVSART
jgi:hypothetical protein